MTQAVEEVAIDEECIKPKSPPTPPTLEENLAKTRETLENIVDTIKLQVLNNFDGFISAIQKEVPGSKNKIDAIKLLLEHMLKSPIKRQMNRISSVAIAVTEFKAKNKELDHG